MPTPDARGRAGMGNGQAPGTPSGSPFAAATAMEVSPLATSTAGTPPVTPSQRRKAGLLSPQSVFETAKLLPKGGGREGGGRGRARTLLYSAATVVMLMLVGMAASELNLRVSSTGAKMLPAPRLSSSAFNNVREQPEGDIRPPPGQQAQLFDDDGAGESLSSSSSSSGSSGGSTITSLLSSAAAAVAQQVTSTVEGLGFGTLADASSEPPKWQLRCAVVNNLVFHIDVMAGWAYAFQSAGCDVTLYIHEKSLGIEDILSSWFEGSFRKPEMFPGEAGDYHIVVLPTFRDQHAELVQYLLQLSRLEKQRYFLTQHNPDWLLNHPNVDILQQEMLLPMLEAARAREREAEAEAQLGGSTAAAAAAAAEGQEREDAQEEGEAEEPLLRVQVVTLAPCVSNYTLGFLRDMAFNITEGQTYTERVGSFHIRTGEPGAADDDAGSKDDADRRRAWIEKAISFEVPWMSPLVPWQRAETPVAVDGKSVAARRLAAGGSRRLWASTNNDDDDEEAEEEQVEDQEGEGSGKDGGEAVDSAASPAPPTPPPEPGAEAAVLLAELDQAAEGSYPRHVCIQGKLENSRRNYTAAFEAISHPAVAAHLRASGERLLLLGHRSKWETVVIPEAVEDVVVVLESLPYQLYFDTLSRCRAIILAFAADDYFTKKSSSTIATAINVGVPLVADRRTLEAYTFLQPAACFIYDEASPSGAGTPNGEEEQEQQAGGGKGGGKAAPQQQWQQQQQQQQRGQRRLLAGGSGGLARALQAADKKGAAGGKKGGKQQQQRQDGGTRGGARAKVEPEAKPKGPPEPAPGSYSAAVLSALRSESSVAAHQAVKALKAEVMNHNVMVAAAFMADTASQYSEQERSADTGAWVARSWHREAEGDADSRQSFWGRRR